MSSLAEPGDEPEDRLSGADERASRAKRHILTRPQTRADTQVSLHAYTYTYTHTLEDGRAPHKEATSNRDDRR